MELQLYSCAEYRQLNLQEPTALFDSISFMQLMAEAYQKDLRIYTVYEKGKALLSFPVLHKGRDARLTTHFFYQAIIKHAEFSDRKFIELWELIILRLKADFDAIDFKLPPYAHDIRPFTWAGFGHKVYYTATLSLEQDLAYSENIRRSVKKGLKAGLSVRAQSFHSEVLSAQLLDMQKNGLSKQEAPIVAMWLAELSKLHHTVFFELLTEEDVLIGSAIFLQDAQEAYLIAVTGGEEQSGGQAFLYDQAFAYFKSKGIRKIDLLGANIPSVAIYKSKLGAETESYVILKYRKYRVSSFITEFCKSSIKNVLKSFRFINK